MLEKVAEMLQGFAKLLRTQEQGHWFLQLPLLRPYSQGRRVILDGLRSEVGARSSKLPAETSRFHLSFLAAMPAFPKRPIKMKINPVLNLFEA